MEFDDDDAIRSTLFSLPSSASLVFLLVLLLMLMLLVVELS